MDKTWENIKTHVEDSHKILRTTRGKIIKSMAYYDVHMLAKQVLVEVKVVK